MADVKMCERYREVQGFWPSLERYKWLIGEILSTNQMLQELGTESQFVWEQIKCILGFNELEETFEGLAQIGADGLELNKSNTKQRNETR